MKFAFFPGCVSRGACPELYTSTVKISEIAAHPTKRLDAGYWIKKQGQAASPKQRATSAKRQAQKKI